MEIHTEYQPRFEKILTDLIGQTTLTASFFPPADPPSAPPMQGGDSPSYIVPVNVAADLSRHYDLLYDAVFGNLQKCTSEASET